MGTEELVGQVIAGKYRLDKVIGRGGFGEVYRGEHLAMQRPVAIKVIPLSHGELGSEAGQERFSQEARLVSQLKASSTVAVFDYGVSQRVIYLVMEHIKGVTLKRYIKGMKRVPVAQAITFAMDILESLEEAHHLGILHRDLKPANVMVYEDFRGERKVKVLDFGIAKMMNSKDSKIEAPGDLTSQQGFVGTPRYAAPEQLFNQGLGPVTDIYAVGLLLWEMVVGEPAIPLKEWGDCSRFHIKNEATPMRIPEEAGVPEGLRRVIEKSVMRFVSQRYQSAGEMRAALTAVQRGEPVEQVGGVDPSGVFFGRGALLDPNLSQGGDVMESGFLDNFEGGEDVERAPVRERRPSRQPKNSSLLGREGWGELDQGAVSADVAPSYREPVAPAPVSPAVERVPMGGKKKPPVLMLVGGGVLVLVLVVGYVMSTSGEEQEGEVETSVVDNLPEEEVFEVPEGRFNEAGIWLAVQSLGWKRVSGVEQINLGNMRQSTAFYEKQGATCELTLVEAKSEPALHELVREVKEPTEVVRFDYRALKIHPVKGAHVQDHVRELKTSLREYRKDVIQLGNQAGDR